MKFLKGVFLFLSILLPLAAVSGILLLRSSLPRRDGTVRLAGLRSPVDVLYDSYAVPHVYASNERDLCRAMGYVHAQERLWQMEFLRRAANGRLSELLGPRTVSVDRRFRTLGLWHAADTDIGRLAPETRVLLEAYAAGVNEFIQTTRTFRPPEFLFLRHRPEPWTIRDSLTVLKLVSFLDSENMQMELLRGLLLSRFGAERTNELLGGPLAAPSALAGAIGRQPAEPPESDKTGLTPAAAVSVSPEMAVLDSGRPASGNAFVVTGSRSKAGKPLLACDLHLPTAIPSLWFEAHLSGGSLDVLGLTLPGIPFVVMGHNKHVAWGLTNLNADSQDMYVEEIDADDPNRYRLGDTWYDMHVDKMLIGVRGGEPVRVRSRWTLHGPVITPDAAEYPGTLSLASSVFSGGQSVQAFLEMDRAGSVAALEKAAALLDAPPRGVTCAAVNGDIAYTAGGVIPLRPLHDGLSPAPGADTRLQWRGFLEESARGRIVNPPQGALVAAGGPATNDPRFVFTNEAESLLRAVRIERLLSERDVHDRTSIAAIQADVYSVESEFYRPHWEALRPRAGGNARLALDLLLSWNGLLDEGPGALLFETFRVRLVDLAVRDDLAELHKDLLRVLGGRRAGAVALLRVPDSPWWDDRTTEAVERLPDILLLALAQSYDHLTASRGGVSSWRWPSVHRVTLAHSLADSRALSRLFNRGPFDCPGDGDSVNRAHFSFDSPFAATSAPVWRAIMDASDWDASVSVLSAGQSGHPLSRNYSDQTPLLLENRYKPMPFSRAAVDKAAVTRLSFSR